MQVLHEVHVGWEGCPGVGLCGGSKSVGVNLEDEGLGQPRQVMTAGMHGPSGQLIFDRLD